MRFLIRLVILFLIGSCSDTAKSNEDSIPLTRVNEFSSKTFVETYSVSKKNFTYNVNASGKINSEQELVMVAQTSGQVINSILKTNAYVTSGMVLLKFDDTNLKLRLTRAEQAKYNSVREYESMLLGYENLLREKSEKEASAIKQKLRIASGVTSAELDIQETELEISKCVVKALFSGVIADVKVTSGQQVQQGQELCRLFDPNKLLVDTKILETDLPLIKKGAVAKIKPLGSKEMFSGIVEVINPYVDPNGMIMVRIRIQGLQSRKSSTLLPGMNCTIVIEVPYGKTLIIPKEALVYRSQKVVVFTYEDGKAKWNEVQVGRDNGEFVEILEGLNEGQKVIVTNNLQLAHDAPVYIQK